MNQNCTIDHMLSKPSRWTNDKLECDPKQQQPVSRQQSNLNIKLGNGHLSPPDEIEKLDKIITLSDFNENFNYNLQEFSQLDETLSQNLKPKVPQRPEFDSYLMMHNSSQPRITRQMDPINI